MIRVMLLAVCITGCRTADLESRWRPLRKVVESPLQKEDMLTTLGSRLIINNLDTWNKNSPKGSIRREANLIHERTHSLRQKELGILTYILRYLVDKKFRWEEEKLANYYELSYYRSKGYSRKNLLERADLLSGPEYGYMVSKEEALTFLNKVWNGTWSPDD